MAPAADLKVEEKQLLCRDFEVKDAHQRDALSAALFSIRKKSTLFRRVEQHLSNNQSIDPYSFTLLVVRDGFSLAAAEAILALPQEQKQIEKKPIAESPPSDVLPVKDIYGKIGRLIRDNQRLLSYVRNLENQLEKAEKERVMMLRRQKKLSLLRQEKINALFFHRDKRAKELEKQLSELKETVRRQKEHAASLRPFLSGISQYYVLKKLPNLSFQSVSQLSIQKGDMLYVDDPGVCNEKAAAHLKDKVEAIITQRIPQSSALHATFIPSDKVTSFHWGGFVFVKKQQIDEIIRSRTNLMEIIHKYKAERKDLGAYRKSQS